MGIAEADINNDGYPEYALTSMGDTKLQTLDDEAEPAGRSIATSPRTRTRPRIGPIPART